MSVNDQYALNWSNHTNHIRKAFDSLLAGNEFVDVTLSCEGKKISAHKMLLSACSTYFHELFRDNPCQHPIVILKDVKFQNLVDILRFMYNGEVSVATENFDSFLKTAELLQVSGLTDDEGRYATGERSDDGVDNSEVLDEKPERLNVRPPVVKKSVCEPAKEKDVKKRVSESTSVEEGTSQKKKKDDELNLDIEIKQEEADILSLEEEQLDIRDPLELGQNESIEGMDMLQPAGSQKFADVHDLLHELPSSTPPEITAAASTSLLPERSVEIYEKTYEKFMKWRNEKNMHSFSENVILNYLSELGKTFKSPTLWSNYSMLKSTISIKHNINIGVYPKVRAYLKRKNEGYTPKKSPTLKKEQVLKFMTEAPDEKYLLTKVILLFGVAGGLRRDELYRLKTDDIEDLGKILIVSVPDTKIKGLRKFTITEHLELYKKYATLRPQNYSEKKFFINFQKGKCTRQVIGINKVGKMPCVIAKYLKLPNPQEYTSRCYRRLSTRS